MFCVFGQKACGILSSLTRDQTCTPCTGRQSLNHWTTREAPDSFPAVMNRVITKSYSHVLMIIHDSFLRIYYKKMEWLC